MKLPRALSHSSISMYLECPQKWKLKYVDGLPEKPRHFFAFGQTMHLALEWFYGTQTLVAPALKDLLAHYKNRWIAEGYASPKQEQEYFTEGQRILTEFHAKHAPGYKAPLYVEYDFSLEVDGVPVTGKVDRIDKLPDGTLSILDYKTGKAIPPERAKADAQLTMYQMACEEKLGQKVSRLSFYHLPSLTPLEVERHDDGLVKALRTRIKGVASSIEAEDFKPAPEERKCNWCDFKPHCPVFRHLYITHHEGDAPPEKIDEEIEGLVRRLGEVKDQIRDLQATAADLEAEIADDMKKKGYPRAYGGSYDVEVAEEETWEFTDKDEVKRLLRSYGLYDRIQVASALQLQKLLKEPNLPPGFLEQVARLGVRKKTRTVKVNKTEPA